MSTRTKYDCEHFSQFELHGFKELNVNLEASNVIGRQETIPEMQ